MDFNIDYNLFRSQKLLLSPHLKQAMEILDMNSQQLSEYVQTQAETNPVLEINFGSDIAEGEQEVLAEEDSPSIISLKEYLLLQLESTLDGNLENAVGEYLIDNTDENGYLITSIEETADFFNIPASFAENVLSVLQTFDPSGICARNLKECLLIQLKQNGDIDNITLEIVEKYLDKLADGDTSSIAEALEITENRAIEVFRLIRTLEPRPGREFYPDGEIRHVVPDIVVKNFDGRFVALFNEDAIPVPDIIDYISEVDNSDEPCEVSAEDRVYIQSRLDNAVWLIKCMEQRKDIILRVAEVIANIQQEFFYNGFRYLKNITPEEISETLDIHKSLVYSALKGKYLQCRWGTFELLYFSKI